MNPSTLRALRQHLFFSVSEAAELIARMTIRSWQYLETGERKVPIDVIETIEHLCKWRNSEINMAKTAIQDAPYDTKIALVWYPTRESWMSMPERDILLWRPQCSVVAELCAVFGAITVPFSSHAYSEWIGENTDSEQMRGNWAAQQSTDADHL